MFFVLLLIVFLLSTSLSPVSAQTLLSHQLLVAYQPQNHQVTFPKVLGLTITNAESTPLDAEGYPYGAKSTPIATPSPLPQNVGGQGPVITIAFLGDSMIQTLDNSVLAKSLNKYYPLHKFNILNYGQGASNIEYAHYRLNNDYQYQDKNLPSLISQKPDIIVIESFAYNNFGNNQSGINRQWLALGAITTDIKEKLPNTKIVLATTIAPHSVTFANDSQFNFTSLEKIEKTNTIKLYLQNMINFATSQNFPLADAFTPSLSKNQANPIFISKTDHLHPSPLGIEFFADTVASTISHYLLI